MTELTNNNQNNNRLEVFNFNGKQVREITIDGEPWFVLRDVCDIIGLDNVSMVAERLKDEEKTNINPTDVGQNGGRDPIVINEKGLYKVVLRSDKPNAEPFIDWVSGEVLPSIRKHGGYIAGQEQMTPEEMVLASIKFMESKIAEQKAQLENQRPLVEFANQVGNTSDSIDLQEFSSVLNISGLGRNKLFRLLREKKYLMNDNLPYRQHIDNNLFKTVEQTYHTPFGDKVNVKTLVTGKGQIYFAVKLKDWGFDNEDTPSS